jgi:hypothetical protein
MVEVRKINGTVVYKSFEGGFWGLESFDGNYYVTDFPEQLKVVGEDITCIIKIDDDIVTFVSWGTPCMIVSFSTIYIEK